MTCSLPNSLVEWFLVVESYKRVLEYSFSFSFLDDGSSASVHRPNVGRSVCYYGFSSPGIRLSPQKVSLWLWKYEIEFEKWAKMIQDLQLQFVQSKNLSYSQSLERAKLKSGSRLNPWETSWSLQFCMIIYKHKSSNSCVERRMREFSCSCFTQILLSSSSPYRQS